MKGPCDIIIPVWNQCAYTRDCVDSIVRNTDSPYRLIIVDNGSDDETRRYLDSLGAMRTPPVTVLRNEKNLGFIKAVNKGIAASSAPYLCILNNDTIVTRGWLGEMIAVAGRERDIGLVNPSSNNLGQRPERGQPLERFAMALGEEAGKYEELGAAIGFCMLIKREVIEKIGVFDEAYGMGNFEDTDLSRRAVKEGYRCVRACGAYVWHRENTSFRKLATFDDDFKRNREIYEFRWGRPRRIAYVLDTYDDTTLAQVFAQSLKLARGGHWVWYFLKEPHTLPAHANIRSVRLPERFFRLRAAFGILKKKKKFDEIYTGDAAFGKALEYLAAIHRAAVKYY